MTLSTGLGLLALNYTLMKHHCLHCTHTQLVLYTYHPHCTQTVRIVYTPPTLYTHSSYCTYRACTVHIQLILYKHSPHCTQLHMQLMHIHSLHCTQTACIVHTQPALHVGHSSSVVRMLVPQPREPGFGFSCCCFKTLIITFTPQFTQLYKCIPG